jgi:hypothetical protein
VQVAIGSISAALGVPLAAVIVFAGIPAGAATKFDGRWSVTLQTTGGGCVARRAVSVDVADGRVTYAGEENVTASGTVPASGRVALRFAYMDDFLDARGSVQGRTGTGSWQSPTTGCKGRWSAVKRG